MNRFAIICVTLLCLLFCSCHNPEKSRMAMDDGINMMYNNSLFTKALEKFDLAIKYDPNNYEAYYYRGCCKFNRNQFEEAIEDLQKAIELNPGYADAEYTLGRIYFVLNDHDMSCYYYKAAKQHGRANVEDLIKGCP